MANEVKRFCVLIQIIPVQSHNERKHAVAATGDKLRHRGPPDDNAEPREVKLIASRKITCCRTFDDYLENFTSGSNETNRATASYLECSSQVLEVFFLTRRT